MFMKYSLSIKVDLGLNSELKIKIFRMRTSVESQWALRWYKKKKKIISKAIKSLFIFFKKDQPATKLTAQNNFFSIHPPTHHPMHVNRGNRSKSGTFRSSRLEVFSRKGVLRNFAKFTGKHLCQSLFFNKVAGLEFFLVRIFQHSNWIRRFTPYQKKLCVWTLLTQC